MKLSIQTPLSFIFVLILFPVLCIAQGGLTCGSQGYVSVDSGDDDTPPGTGEHLASPTLALICNLQDAQDLADTIDCSPFASQCEEWIKEVAQIDAEEKCISSAKSEYSCSNVNQADAKACTVGCNKTVVEGECTYGAPTVTVEPFVQHTTTNRKDDCLGFGTYAIYCQCKATVSYVSNGPTKVMCTGCDTWKTQKEIEEELRKEKDAKKKAKLKALLTLIKYGKKVITKTP